MDFVLYFLLLRWLLLISAIDAFVTYRNDFYRDHGTSSIITTSYSTNRYADIPRRKFQSRFFGGLLGGEILSFYSTNIDDAIADVTKSKALVDIPMVRLRLPKGGFGREYIALKLKIQGEGPYDFMVDSGLTSELITPHLQSILGIQEGKNRLSALAAGGSTVSNPIVELKGASIDFGDDSSSLDLPKLTAVITDFPQEHVDPAHDPVEGMLGMELLSLFDVDLDFSQNRIRLFEPRTIDTSGLVELPAVVINESMLIGIRISAPDQRNGQPILGLLDCGSTFSCINWKAAQALGLPPKNDSLYRGGPAVAALGIDGRALTLPTVKKQLSYTGDPIVDPNSKTLVGFETPPSNWKPWDPVQLAVGDLPVFSNILGDGSTPYDGPAALIGLDILSQRRLVLEAGTSTSRRRQVAIAPN